MYSFFQIIRVTRYHSCSDGLCLHNILSGFHYWWLAPSVYYTYRIYLNSNSNIALMLNELDNRSLVREAGASDTRSVIPRDESSRVRWIALGWDSEIASGVYGMGAALTISSCSVYILRIVRWAIGYSTLDLSETMLDGPLVGSRPDGAAERSSPRDWTW